MIIFALDTNIISYLLKDDDAVFKNYKQEIKNGNRFIIPPVVYYEITRGLLIKKATVKANYFDLLCKDFGIGEMNNAIWNEAARLYALNRKQGIVIEDADLFIAAFCLFNKYTLVTNNIRHFSGIDGLQTVNWKD